MEELTTEQEIRQVFFLMRELRPYLEEEDYIKAVLRMKKDGYRMFAWREKDTQAFTVLAGLKFQENLYDGFHLWLDDFVTAQNNRSRGIGKQALSDIESFAKARGAKKIVLSSGMKRTAAHSFYEEKMNYRKKSYVFASFNL